MNNDQTILDVVVDVTKDLRHTASFRELLHPLDDETARRVANAYIDFLSYDGDREQTNINNNLSQGRGGKGRWRCPQRHSAARWRGFATGALHRGQGVCPTHQQGLKRLGSNQTKQHRRN